jgi:hypothetical protein
VSKEGSRSSKYMHLRTWPQRQCRRALDCVLDCWLRCFVCREKKKPYRSRKCEFKV